MVKAGRRIRILYVCPWAHWAGHPPWAAMCESAALAKTGAEVSLCTCRGILGQKEPQIIPHRIVVSSWIGIPLDILVKLLLSVKISPVKGFAWFLENLATLLLAVKLRKTLKYDVIYLRDGDPFIFTPFLLGLVFKHYKWAISLIGVKALMPPFSSWYHKLFSKFLNTSIWKPIYHRSLAKNQFIFHCQNKYIKDYFETSFLGGTLAGRISVVPIGVEQTNGNISQEEARHYLNLPEDKVIFLHFGSLHSGKDIETVIASLKDIPDACLVHAGAVDVRLSLMTSQKLADSIQRYGLQERIIIRNHFVPESEKQYYFGAADAVILSYKKDSIQTASLYWQAARFGLPTIASDIGELGELIKEYKTGELFIAEDVDSLKRALCRFLLSNPSERMVMRDNCKKFCNKFSLDEWAKNCIEQMRKME